MTDFEGFVEIIRKLRAPDGCPWDREQTHASLKGAMIEEASEVLAAINLLEATGSADNLREELGDMLLQVVMHAQIAQEEGLFTMADVVDTVSEKMIRRHPHVFGQICGSGNDPDGDPDQDHSGAVKTSEDVLRAWEEIKRSEKKGKEPMEGWLSEAFMEAEELIDVARRRKGIKKQS